jgi:hypothetical protein
MRGVVRVTYAVHGDYLAPPRPKLAPLGLLPPYLCSIRMPYLELSNRSPKFLICVAFRVHDNEQRPGGGRRTLGAEPWCGGPPS